MDNQNTVMIKHNILHVKMLNKKGISPLIATVLIIGFTIIIAVLVITWTTGLVKDQADLKECEAKAAAKCTPNTKI